MDYVTVFEAFQEPFRNLGFLWPGLVLSIAGAVLVWRPTLLEKIGFRRATRWPIFNWFFFLFAVFWTIAAGTAVLGGALGAKDALAEGSCQIVEGTVENFHPMPKSGHDTERFDVDGVHFSYSDFIVSPGFNNTASHGGPIREGLQVRICHKDGDILRLEVAR